LPAKNVGSASAGITESNTAMRARLSERIMARGQRAR
jgi:hypothetical protein